MRAGDSCLPTTWPIAAHPARCPQASTQRLTLAHRGFADPVHPPFRGLPTCTRPQEQARNWSDSHRLAHTYIFGTTPPTRRGTFWSSSLRTNEKHSPRGTCVCQVYRVLTPRGSIIVHPAKCCVSHPKSPDSHKIFAAAVRLAGVRPPQTRRGQLMVQCLQGCETRGRSDDRVPSRSLGKGVVTIRQTSKPHTE